MTARALRRCSAAFAAALAVSLGAAGAARAAGVEPARATPVQREQAQGRFLRGRQLFLAKKYAAALTELTASLDIVASPNTRLYVGRCLREMGRSVAAYVELGRTAVEAKELLRDDNRYDKAAQAASEERAQLAPKLGFVDVHVARAAPATVLKVNGDEVRRGGWDEPIPVMPGAVELVVDTPGHPPVQQTTEVAAGLHVRVDVDADADLPPAPVAAPVAAPAAPEPPRPTLRPALYATAGLGVAGLATFLVAGAMSRATYSNLESACGAGPCPPGHEGEISMGKTQQTVANVGLAVFAVSAAASVTLFFVGAPKRSASAATTAAARLSAGPSFVGLAGAF